MANSPYDPVPDVSPQMGGTGAEPSGVRASPMAFGAGIGEAMQGLGKSAENLGGEAIKLAGYYATQATEAKVSDTIANGWGPSSSKLSADYYSLQGKNAVDGLDPYLNKVRELGKTYVDQAQTPLEKQLLSGYINRHITAESESAMRYQVHQLTAYEDQSTSALIKEQTNLAVQNYALPDRVTMARQTADALFLKHGMDRGIPMEEIRQQQRDSWGSATVGMVNRALENNDIHRAWSVYAENIDSVPWDKQLEIDKQINKSLVTMESSSNVLNLMSGNPIKSVLPSGIVQARQETISAAKVASVDVNHALTVLRIESSDGQNLGKRGDIGQTGKPASSLSEQAKNMCDEIKRSQDIADSTIGGRAEGWQAYIVYQQGAGGGPALLKAMGDNPNARAVDVLKPLYKSPEEALSAITNNGGNATMSVKQYLGFVKQKYEVNLKDCSVDVASLDNKTPGAPAIAVQPSSDPIMAFKEFDSVYPNMVERARAIPNIEERAQTLNDLARTRDQYSFASARQQGKINQQIEQIAENKNFTSMSQIPQSIRATLTDNPDAVSYLEKRAFYNASRMSGLSTGDSRTYGESFYPLFQAIHARDGEEGRITNPAQLYGYVGNGLTISGYDKLKKEMSDMNTPEGGYESELRKQFFASARSAIITATDLTGKATPQSEEQYLRFMSEALSDIDKGKSDGKTAKQLYDPASPDYVGKSIKMFVEPLEKRMADLRNSFALRTYKNKDDLLSDVEDGKITREKAVEIAIKNQWVRPNAPPVPPVPISAE